MAAVVANPAPAAAASTTVYLWSDANFSGYSTAHYTWDPNFAGQFYSGGGAPSLNDTVSSIWNVSSYRICFYRHANFIDQLMWVAPGEQILNVGPVANDQISSMSPC